MSLESNINSVEHSRLIATFKIQNSQIGLERIEILSNLGCDAFEIHASSAHLVQNLTEAVKSYGSKAIFGVSAINDVDSIKVVAEAGARFVVLPSDTTKDIIEYAHSLSLAVAVFCYSPQEIHSALLNQTDFIYIQASDVYNTKIVTSYKNTCFGRNTKFIISGEIEPQQYTEWMKVPNVVTVAIGHSISGCDYLFDSQSDDFMVSLLLKSRSLIMSG